MSDHAKYVSYQNYCTPLTLVDMHVIEVKQTTHLISFYQLNYQVNYFVKAVLQNENSHYI